MAATDSNQASHWKLLSVLLLGILIPLAAAAVPWILETFVPESSLKYSFQGPISSDQATALAIRIENDGRVPEENLEVWIPIRTIGIAAIVEPNVDSMVEVRRPDIIIESDIKETSIEATEKFRIIKYKTIRPGEIINITLFSFGVDTFFSEYSLSDLRIVSDNGIGETDIPNEFLAFFYPFAAWGLLTGAVLFIIYGIYYEYFMTYEEKKKYILKELSKLQRKNKELAETPTEP